MSAPALTDAKALLAHAEQICSAEEIAHAVERVATEISDVLAARNPLVLVVMSGGIVFGGHLLTRLTFPLDFDYLHLTRYGESTQGGQIEWKVLPRQPVRGRTVLVIDDILDEGNTLAAVRERLLADGAAAFYSVVFADKDIGRAKPITADFVGITLPNRFVFGFGMDVQGIWRNLPAIYALKG
jgi:hypoxanthine phosphoribosyltransferase